MAKLANELLGATILPTAHRVYAVHLVHALKLLAPHVPMEQWNASGDGAVTPVDLLHQALQTLEAIEPESASVDTPPGGRRGWTVAERDGMLVNLQTVVVTAIETAMGRFATSSSRAAAMHQ